MKLALALALSFSLAGAYSVQYPGSAGAPSGIRETSSHDEPKPHGPAQPKPAPRPPTQKPSPAPVWIIPPNTSTKTLIAPSMVGASGH